jgi:asparagine synthase (glutamine-hydrolysing)
MCGIAGIWQFGGEAPNYVAIRQMVAAERHRGPDDVGFLSLSSSTGDWSESMPDALQTESGGPTHDVLFGFRRLAILDLSALGHQPMRNADGSLWLVFNGEIYNYIELREELMRMGRHFRSGTDSEVILQAYDQWGESCVERFNGMWAFALWDQRRQHLFCSRDRFGVKPFYYYYDENRFVFGSEIKVVLQHPAVHRAPNHSRVLDFLAFRMLDHTEETCFTGIRQILPSTSMTVSRAGLRSRKYWTLDATRVQSTAPEAARARFIELFTDSVRLRMRSDVQVGSCLSGGLDSSSIVCVMDRLLRAGPPSGSANSNQFTFSSCFDESRYDERQYIQAVVGATNVTPHYVFPSPRRLAEESERLVWHLDEPFVGTSTYAQWDIMRTARSKGVTVLLDGQGADELLAGYPTYYGSRFADLAARGSGRELLREVRTLERNGWARYRGTLLKSFAYGMAPAWIRAQAHRVRALLQTRWLTPDAFDGYHPAHHSDIAGSRLSRHLHRMLTSDQLPALLHYEDRTSMAASVEARVPFLDYRFVEFIFSLDDSFKLARGRTKVVLRDAMAGIVPAEVLSRTDKMGFVTPEDLWFRDELRDFAYDVISSASFGSRGLVDQKQALALFERHERGEVNVAGTLWRWINLELWMRQFIDRAPSV